MKALSTKHKTGELSPAVLHFAQIMQDRLDGSGRSGYQSCAFSELVTGLKNNVEDLEQCLLDRTSFTDDGEAVTWPAADVANYAMFIALNHIFNE